MYKTLALTLPHSFFYLNTPVPTTSRNAAIVLTVVVLHVGFIWALYSGLLMRAVELVVPVTVIAQFIEPPQPKVAPALPTPPPPRPNKPQVKPVVLKTTALAAPLPIAIKDPTPAENAPTGVITPQPAPAPVAATGAAAHLSGLSPQASSAVQLPSSDADYLQNPRPPYPAISRRLNEQGKTTVRVLIGADGQPQRAEIAKSSGFTRLDEAAVTTVMRWRFVPGKRGGVAEAMWFNVPINWVLE